MKELTTEMTLKVTNVEKLDANNIETYMAREKDPVHTRYFEDTLKNTIGYDDVKVVDMKHFVKDLDEKKEEETGDEDLTHDQVGDIVHQLIERLMDGAMIDILAEKVAEKLKPTISVETFFDDTIVAEKVGSGMLMRRR